MRVEDGRLNYSSEWMFEKKSERRMDRRETDPNGDGADGTAGKRSLQNANRATVIAPGIRRDGEIKERI